MSVDTKIQTRKMVKTRPPFQQEINTDGQWEKLLNKEGLTVVDVYSEWCGPCKAMIRNLKTIKRTFIEYSINLAIAKSDTVADLKEFRNRSEPTWIFIVKGKVVNVMYGADAPKLARLVAEELKKKEALKEDLRDRAAMEISNLHDEENVHYGAEEAFPVSETGSEMEWAKAQLEDKSG